MGNEKSFLYTSLPGLLVRLEAISQDAVTIAANITIQTAFLERSLVLTI